jgi:hypothetical protein
MCVCAYDYVCDYVFLVIVTWEYAHSTRRNIRTRTCMRTHCTNPYRHTSTQAVSARRDGVRRAMRVCVCVCSEQHQTRQVFRVHQIHEHSVSGQQTADSRHQTPDTRHQTPDSRQQTPDSRQQTADSRQQTADSRQQIADSRQQTADTRQQTADSRHQTPDSRRQTADSRQQTADSRQQTADSRQQTADSR